MKAHPQIFWQQGLLLHPQHFQLQDQVHHAALAPVYRFALPFFWGVAELSLDEAALAEGAVVVLRGAFLFQDGSYCVLHENAVLEGRVLQDAWEEGGAQLTLYLGLKRWNDTGANVSLRDGGSLSSLATRLVASAEGETVEDLHAGGPAAQVQRQSFLLKLFLERELPGLGDYHLLPLARVEREGGGARLVRRFVPPLLCVGASPWLVQAVGALRALLGGRLAELERRRTAQKAGAQLTAGDLALIMAQRSLNSHLPVLTHLSQTSSGHPWGLYLALCQLQGELATFCTEKEHGGSVPYDHADLSRCFSSVAEAIARSLDEIMAAPDDTVPLVRDGAHYFADLKGLTLGQGRRYFLSVRTESDPVPLLRSLQGTAKASTREHLKVLSAMALPGIGLIHTPVPPHGLSPRPNTLYVELDQDHEQWRTVCAEGNLALYWDGAPEDLQIELITLARHSVP